ncbi:MAG: hypothetical protein NT159_06135 [Proteobacteria bacterium]|nr:hypothetical protein [Pseudomonadota bacterium]
MPIPSFGSLLTRLWGVARGNNTFTKPYSWLFEESTLLVFNDYLAVTRGALGKSGFASAMNSGGFGLVGGLFSAAISIKNSVSNKSERFEQGSMRDSFNNAELAWCKKDDAEFWEIRYMTKGFMSSAASNSILYCPVNTLGGRLHLLFPLSFKNSQTSTGHFMDHLKCRSVVKADGLTEDEARTAYIESPKWLPVS